LKKWFFSSNIIKIPKRWSIEKKEKTYWKKREKEKNKRKKKKAPRVSSNKGEVNILRGEKHFNFKIFFLMWFHFLPLHHTISKTSSKIIEKVFLTLFVPSFSLAIYITWVVPFLLTHDLHIFSLQRVGWEGTFVELRWGTTY
jgi:hypothetical protein